MVICSNWGLRFLLSAYGNILDVGISDGYFITLDNLGTLRKQVLGFSAPEDRNKSSM